MTSGLIATWFLWAIIAAAAVTGIGLAVREFARGRRLGDRIFKEELTRPVLIDRHGDRWDRNDDHTYSMRDGNGVGDHWSYEALVREFGPVRTPRLDES